MFVVTQGLGNPQSLLTQGYQSSNIVPPVLPLSLSITSTEPYRLTLDATEPYALELTE